ncbi:gamma-butyrobetaine dioxygenase [Trichoderma arundinaceum]|uniref:Gamma-butyrobetaine dioxygenase n=1 Tax=Trichoderma arundinaceum TaxID=490622 RepID=A0A395NTR1_TRIAR|nr:gamma-butyrobetaine dioxygenase [Trichoderma arundinaceum]
MLSLARTSRAAATAKAKAKAQAVACRGVGTQAPWKQRDKQKQANSDTGYMPQTRRILAKEAAATATPLGASQQQQQQTSAARYWPKLEIPRNAKRFTYEAEAYRGDPVKVAWTDKFLFVEDPATENGRRALKPATLRDSCSCPRCRDASSGQKTYSSVEIPVDIGLRNVKPTKKGLEIKFLQDIPRFVDGGEEHVMVLPWESVDLSLKRKGMEDVSLPRKRSVLRRTGAVYWDREIIAQQVRRIDYAEFMKDDSEAFWDVIVDICRFGLVYLKNVPRDEESVVRITTRIANIRETFYGRTFDVRAKPNAENVAYTSGYLGLHQDLLYLDPPPMIQVLHCMDNSCAGGESLFSDGERVGRLLWPFVTRHRMAPLAEHHVPYQYGKNGYHYFSSRYVLDGNEAGFANVYWSPPFQGRYLSPVKDIRRWIEPARIFADLINHQDAIHEHKMEPGECVLFDNLRVLHGRNSFDAAGGGARWLRGAYIAAEDFLSRAAHIPKGFAEKYRGERTWTPGLAQSGLRESIWHEDVVRRVKEIDPRVDE